MNHQLSGVSVAFATVVVVSLLMPSQVAGQAPATDAGAFTAARTADGQPDLQGFWRVSPGGSYNIQDLEMHWIYQRGTPNPEVRGMSRIVGSSGCPGLIASPTTPRCSSQSAEVVSAVGAQHRTNP